MTYVKNIGVSRNRETPSTLTSKKSSGLWRCGDYLLNYKKRPLIMGVLNVTPDSFSDGGDYFETEAAFKHALQLVEEGIDIIDIGGESTRPGALSVPFEEELSRVLPIIKKIVKKISIPISIDTRKPEIAIQAIEAGASIINDVSGINANPEMLSVAASRNKAGLIFMHAKGSPETMQKSPRYRDVVSEIYDFFMAQIIKATEFKISRNRIAIDPGVGFGKTLKHNLSIIHHLDKFSALGVPVMLGPSRKSFIGKLLDLPASERLEGTAAAVAIAVFQGANILRVHDAGEMKRVVLIAEAIRKQKDSS